MSLEFSDWATVVIKTQLQNVKTVYEIIRQQCTDPALLSTSCFCPGRTALQTLGSWALYVSGYQHFLPVSLSLRLSSGPCLEQQDVRHLLHRPREPPATASRMCSVWASQSAHTVTLLIVNCYWGVFSLSLPVCTHTVPLLIVHRYWGVFSLSQPVCTEVEALTA